MSSCTYSTVSNFSVPVDLSVVSNFLNILVFPVTFPSKILDEYIDPSSTEFVLYQPYWSKNREKIIHYYLTRSTYEVVDFKENYK